MDRVSYFEEDNDWIYTWIYTIKIMQGRWRRRKDNDEKKTKINKDSKK